ncbi:MAG: hypothetical protein ACMXX6_00335 [Candidatus Woesearchaeota archaeon]
MFHLKDYLKLPNGVSDVYLALTLYGVGMSLIGIFVPIYLIETGYSISMALFYILISKLVFVLLTKTVVRLDNLFGLQGTSLIRLPFFIASFVGLIFIESASWIFYFSAITAGVSLAFFWIPIQTFFLHNSHLKSEGKEVGKMLSIPTFFKILSPAVGGYISAIFGFNTLFVIGLLIVSLSTAPLFLTKTQKTKYVNVTFKDIKKVLGFKMFFMTLADGFVYVSAGILFPLFIYLNLVSVESVGLIMSLGSVFFAVASFVIGSKLKDSNISRFYFFGAIVFALTLFVRPFLSSFIEFAIIIVFGALTAALYESSYITSFYSSAKKNLDPDAFFIAREYMLNLSRSLLLILLLFVPFEWGFFIAAIFLVLAAFLIKKT